MGVTFYFVRHAQTYLNKYERMQGWANAPLTPVGIIDCQACGRGLREVPFDAVYTSDLNRTRETAQIILAENKYSKYLEINEMAELREIFFGAFEGLPIDDVWPDIVEEAGEGDISRKRLLDCMHEAEPTKDSENYMAFWMRIERALQYLVNKYRDTDKKILVVSHGLALNIMFSGIIADYDFDGHLDNASVTKVVYQNGQFELKYLNSTDHFIYE